MAAPKRSKFKIIADRVEIAQRYLKGQTQAEIGLALNMTREMVTYDLKAIRKEWKESRLRDFDDLQSQELEKVDHLERAYWEAWDKSMAETTSKTQYIRSGGKAGTPKQTRLIAKTDPGLGDPRYLVGVQWCIEKRCRILGLDAPVKVAPTDPSGLMEYSGGSTLTDDERLRRLATVLDTVRARRDRPADSGIGADPIIPDVAETS